MSKLFTNELIAKFQNEVLAMASATGAPNPFGGLQLMNAESARRAFSFISKSPAGYIVDQCMLSCRSCIGAEYLKDALDNAFRTKERRFDVALLVKHDPTKQVVRGKKKALENFDVVGFVVVEIGECHKLPNTASINLICAREFENHKNAGRTMMALFCYFILSSPSLDQRGILEVAGGFENPGAFCMYQKFGFKPDYSLYSATDDWECFNWATLIPMMVDFNGPDFAGLSQEEKKRKILEVVVKNSNIGKKDQICEVRDGQALFAFLRQFEVLLFRGDVDENLPHVSVAIEISNKTNLRERDFPKLQQFIMEKKMNGNPSWADYIAKLSAYVAYLMHRDSITCGAKAPEVQLGPMPPDLFNAIVSMPTTYQPLNVPTSPNASRANTPKTSAPSSLQPSPPPSPPSSPPPSPPSPPSPPKLTLPVKPIKTGPVRGSEAAARSRRRAWLDLYGGRHHRKTHRRK